MPSSSETKPAPDGRMAGPKRALALLYALQFGHVGVVLPFLAPWIESRGFGALGIGVLLSFPALAAVIAPWSWGSWADRSGRRRDLLVVAGLGAGLALSILTVLDGAWAIAAGMAAYSFLRAPVLPYLEATTLEQSERSRFAYGPVRLWGSLSFIAVSTGYGALRGRLSDDAGLVLAAAFLGTAALAAAIALPHPLGHLPGRADERKVGAARRENGLPRILAACALMQMSHGCYYAFYSIRLQNLGYDGAAIGALWALGVLCEVLLLTSMDRVVTRFGSLGVMRASIAVAVIRWAVIGSSTGAVPLALAQTLHAVTYAAFHVAAVREVFRRFGPGARAKGQAIYSGMTYGVGLFTGSLGAGWLAGWVGIANAFVASAAVALAGVLVLGRGRR